MDLISPDDREAFSTAMTARKIQAPEDRSMTLLRLLKAAHSVELKLSVPDSDQRSAVINLDIDVLDAELRQVVFFDTPDLQLRRAGIVLRARRARKGGDSVVKLRPIEPGDLPVGYRRSNDFRIEVDVMPGAFVCSGSLKDKVANAEVKDVIQGNRAVRKLFSPAQRLLYTEYAPTGLELDTLKPFGPINLMKSKFLLNAYSAIAELWFYPDGSRVLELSMKCAAEEAVPLAAEARAFLSSRGITVTGEQQTKTTKALEYFAGV